MQYHKYSLTEIENMIPWERDVYVGLLKNHLEEEEQKQQQRPKPSAVHRSLTKACIAGHTF